MNAWVPIDEAGAGLSRVRCEGRTLCSSLSEEQVRTALGGVRHNESRDPGAGDRTAWIRPRCRMPTRQARPRAPRAAPWWPSYVLAR